MTSRIGLGDIPGQHGGLSNLTSCLNSDRLPCCIGLTYTPVYSNFVFILPYHFKQCIIRQWLTFTNYKCPLWGQPQRRSSYTPSLWVSLQFCIVSPFSGQRFFERMNEIKTIAQFLGFSVNPV